ncbi:MAG: Cytidylate kinase [Planctomycetes bacterium]|nr:Cytidylate kinase [Planctomycetota bacterium]MCQ3948470.1 (d)CMP kinase [Planctomycetota bacterium]GIK51336.1 MAG: cytidylate kinase [Planctomycetota bacterium]HRJ76992.1 (d)CMP kinase [Planctomycetota bacterium]
MSNNIITIDGPSGAGKSTITRLAAQRLGLRYLDTGAMYRALTLHCMRKGIKLDNSKAVAEAARGAALRCELTLDGPMRVFLGAEDVTDKIRTQEVTRNIHYVADVFEVRDLMVKMQREIGRDGNLVTEGRDQGTVVFPDAALKVFMFATPEVRARRRHAELKAKGVEVSYEEVLEDISRRDYLDQGREVGALRKARDAVELDTSSLTPEEVSEAIVKLAKNRLMMRTRKVERPKP